jgi:hypothetical protein
MSLSPASWSCARCGAGVIGIPPEHSLCEDCVAVLEAQITASDCQTCGGPVCADCGQRIALAVPVPWPMTIHIVNPLPAERVTGDGG